MEPIISIKHLVKSFGDKEVLKDINLDVYPGEVVSVIGSSGSGKSTMLRCINKLEEADSPFFTASDVSTFIRLTSPSAMASNIFTISSISFILILQSPLIPEINPNHSAES